MLPDASEGRPFFQERGAETGSGCGGLSCFGGLRGSASRVLHESGIRNGGSTTLIPTAIRGIPLGTIEGPTGAFDGPLGAPETRCASLIADGDGAVVVLPLVSMRCDWEAAFFSVIARGGPDAGGAGDVNKRLAPFFRRTGAMRSTACLLMGDAPLKIEGRLRRSGQAGQANEADSGANQEISSRPWRYLVPKSKKP